LRPAPVLRARDAAATLAAIRRFAATRRTIYLPTYDPAAAGRLDRRECVSAK
jgi:hypothetical protein